MVCRILKNSAHAVAAAIALDLKEYKEKAIEIHLGQRIAAASIIIGSILFVMVFPSHHLIGMRILVALNAIDLISAIFIKTEKRTKLYTDRISEAIMFSIAGFPWFILVVVNYILAIFRLTTDKKTPIIPLRLIFLLFLIFELI